MFLRFVHHHLQRQLLHRMALDATALVVLAAVLPALIFSAPIDMALTIGLVLAGCVVVINNLSGFYERLYARPFAQTFARGVLATAVAVAVAWSALQWVAAPAWDQGLSHELLQACALFATASVMLWRSAASHRTAAHASVGRRVLVLGTGEAAHRLRQSLQEVTAAVHIVGHVAGPVEPDSRPAGLNLLKGDGGLADIAREHRIDEVLVALSERRGGAMPLRELLDCRIRGYEVNDINTHFERNLGMLRLEHLSAHWLIFGEGFNQGLLRTAVKRLFDLISATLLLAPGLPLMLVAAAAIRLESPGPVLYRQERTGLGGRRFQVIKLRSMRTDAEGDGRPRWATTNDARITRVGRFIRATRIDELPQLLNVLRGDMSLVGPRPERPYFVEQLAREIPFYAVRHCVKPGLTGWAQVRCDYGSSVDEARTKLQYDLYYVKNHSLLLDLLIVLETVGVVLTGKGAR